MTRVAKHELEALASAVEYFESEGLPIYKGLKSLQDKLGAKAKDTPAGGMTPAQIENVLVQYSSDKVIPVIAARSVFWIKQFGIWKGYGPTETQVQVVARWLGKQAWMSPQTIDQVAWKWPQYLAKAQHDEKQCDNTSFRREFVGEE